MPKFKKNYPFWVGLVVVVFFVAFGCCFFAKKGKGTVTETPTNPIFAEIALKNLAVGMRTYSSMAGGGGNVTFTGDVSLIKEYVMREAVQALPGKEQKPYNGYVFELMENPVGDGYKNNFKFVAHPAKGFVGQSFQIDKFEKVTPIE